MSLKTEWITYNIGTNQTLNIRFREALILSIEAVEGNSMGKSTASLEEIMEYRILNRDRWHPKLPLTFYLYEYETF
jgi:hypothetical protein